MRTPHHGQKVAPLSPSSLYSLHSEQYGKKIFEGDIVEGIDFSAEDGYGVVQWDDGAFEVVGNDICGTFHENYWGKYFEVIGNKFDGGKDDSQ